MLHCAAITLLLAAALAARAAALDAFERDPQWEGYRNRLLPDPVPVTRQRFGYSATQHAGGMNRGEIGGWVQRSTTPAWYARRIPPVGLDRELTVSGRFVVAHNEGGSGVLFGFFNAESRGWRMPNSLAVRLDGNGGKFWLLFEYGTRNWFTGGGATFEGRYQTTKTKPFLDGVSHSFRLTYRPGSAGQDGELTLVLDGIAYRESVSAAHIKDSAIFDRVGIVNQQLTGDGMEVYFDDLEVNGEPFEFDTDPGWESHGSQVKFADPVRRPFHDFGYQDQGNVGGIIWRDELPAFYGKAISPVTLEQPFSASGTIRFCSGGSDSGAYIGFFDAAAKRKKTSADHKAHPTNILAIMVEGPSHAGFYFRGGYRNHLAQGMFEDSGPTIKPDGHIHTWSLRYLPNGSDRDGEIQITFDGQTQRTRVRKEHKSARTRFDRFGLFNIQSGGHYVEIYLDDVELRVTQQ